jgi:hypothetical protein
MLFTHVSISSTLSCSTGKSDVVMAHANPFRLIFQLTFFEECFGINFFTLIVFYCKDLMMEFVIRLPEYNVSAWHRVIFRPETTFVIVPNAQTMHSGTWDLLDDVVV